jgi:iron complex transport system permease protein
MRKNWLVIRPQQLPVSFHLDQRVPTVLLVLGLVTLMAIVLNVGQGEYPIPPLEVLKTILGLPIANPDYPFIINTLRLPRTLVAFAAGVGLALSGTILQGLTRNPLADPGIIGVNAGAGLAAVSLIVLFPNIPLFVLPLSAFAGALTCCYPDLPDGLGQRQFPTAFNFNGCRLCGCPQCVDNLNHHLWGDQ